MCATLTLCLSDAQILLLLLSKHHLSHHQRLPLEKVLELELLEVEHPLVGVVDLG